MTRYALSKEHLERAKKLIPLATQTFSKAWNRWPHESPHFLSHGRGGRVWDIDGRQYVDLVGALLPNVLGYRDSDVDYAISRQLERGISFSLPTVLEFELAQRLVRHIPCAEMARFGKSGSDATTAAVRVARAYTGRNYILLTPPGYHGWHDWSIGRAENEDNRAGVPIPVRNYSGSSGPPWDTAAIIADCSKHSAEDLQFYRQEADKLGALLIFDEVITGFRWNIGGAQKVYAVTPDLACFSKAMGNGMPISAVVGRADIMGLFDHVFFSGTFGGETLSLAAACATIDKIEREDVPSVLAEDGNYLATAASLIIQEAGLSRHIWLDGHAAWKQLHFSSPAVREAFLTAMLANGVLINTCHAVCYGHSNEDFELVLIAYRAAMDEVARVAEKEAA